MRERKIEVAHVLDYALASAIARTADLPAARLWRWTINVRDHAWSNLAHQAAEALAAWLDENGGREAGFFDAILAADDPTTGPWVVPNTYIRVTRRHPCAAVIRHVLAKAATSFTKAEKRRLLAIAVDVARRPQTDIETYWETYDRIAPEPGCKRLLRHLTTETIDQWRRSEWARVEKARQRDAKVKAGNVRAMAPALADMRVGGQPVHLDWAARGYFEGENDRSGRPTGVQRVIDLTDEVTTEAILAGWGHLATLGFGGIGTAEFGKAEAEGRRYYVEAAVIAGVDLLISDDRLPAPSNMPIEVAVAVLKSGWIVPDEERRARLERWALDRLNVDPTVGATQIVDFWGAALDAGATRLIGSWRLTDGEERRGAVEQALDCLLGTRRAMAPDALRTALRAGVKQLDHARLRGLAEAALADLNVTGAQRKIWTFVAFALDPLSHVDRFMAEYSGEDAAALFNEELSGGLVEAFGSIAGAARLHRDTMAVRLLGRTARPEDDQLDGFVTGPHRVSHIVSGAITALTGDPSPEAGKALSILEEDPGLTAWRFRLRHARAQQAHLHRDHAFIHPTASAVRAATAGGPPVNASDLRAVVMGELQRLRAELHTTDTTPWKRYWNVDSQGKVDQPRIENECRDHLLDRLRDRLKRYEIAAAVPEARRGEETRADILVLTGAGRNLPVEAKRHFHADIWVAASTQLQGYATDPGADGFGIYLVFWFGDNFRPTPARTDSGAEPTSAVELEAMLVHDLTPELRARTDVIVFDLSDPAATGRKKPRQRRRGGKAQTNGGARSASLTTEPSSLDPLENKIGAQPT